MRWAKKEHITDGILKNVIDEISNGLIDADLGGGLVKKRLSRKGEGKRGGHRVLLAFKHKDRSIFIFGFSKNDRENLDEEEKELYKKLSKAYLEAPISNLEKMCVAGLLCEVNYEGAKQSAYLTVGENPIYAKANHQHRTDCCMSGGDK